MALRDDLKNYIALKVWQTIAAGTGDTVTADRWNELFNLLIAQGDDTTANLKNTLDMLYETILEDTNGALHVNFSDAGFAALTVDGALKELAVRIATNLANIQSNDTDIQAGVDALNAHKSSADHDGRYYTEAEIDTFEAAMQLLVNQNAANLVSVQNQINALDDIYSTDAERAAAIAATIAAFELADDDLEALVNGKANASDVYTKAEIDAMTLGSYKMDIDQRYVILGADTPSILIESPGWNADTDTIVVSQGGLEMNQGAEWEFNVAKDSIVAIGDPFPSGSRISYMVIRNLRVVSIEDQFDGSLILDATIARPKLNSGLIAELDGLRTDVDTKATVLYGTGTIPTTGWVANTGDYALKNNAVNIAELLASDWIDITINANSHDVAGVAELCPTVVENTGFLTTLANNIPTEQITFKWKVVR